MKPSGPALALAACALVAALGPQSAGAATTLEPVGAYSAPVYVTSDPDDAGRLFIVERAGRIQLTTTTGTSEFLDLSSLVATGIDQGLLSMAFPPDHAETGLFYVFYTEDPSGDVIIAELHSLGNVANPASLREVLRVTDAQYHNGGQLQFGPDGYLYISIGDGDAPGDPDGNGQNPATLLGALLRIDPGQSGSDPYTVPVDNPYVGTANADEIWSWGLRNPWRFSFDRDTGALTLGDVGQGGWEEVNYRPQSVGGGRADNFGWNCREGFVAYPGAPEECEGAGPFTDPVFAYPISGQPECAIMGGYVVRDPSLADLYGRYLYGDLCTGAARSIMLELPLAQDDRAEGLSVPNLVSFGEDADGRIYVVSLGGAVSRLADGGEDPAPEDPPADDPAPEDPSTEDPAPEDPPTDDPAPEDPSTEDPAPGDPSSGDEPSEPAEQESAPSDEPPPSNESPPADEANASPLAKLVRRILRVRRGVASARLACRAAERCVGRAILRRRRAARPGRTFVLPSGRRTSRLGRARYSIPAGEARRVRIKLNKRARRLLRRNEGRLRARLILRASDGASSSTAVRLRRR